jgi:hypothetical protein
MATRITGAVATAILVAGPGLVGPISAQPLPEGDTGIAVQYPGDAGIDAAADVIFADDFEAYGSVSDLTSPGRWDEAYHSQNIRLATEEDNYYSGAKGLELTVPQTGDEVSNTVIKYMNPTREIVFMRFYAKYDNAFDVAGSSHNGCSLSASYWDGPGSGPGIPADGYNKFFVSFEAGRDSSGPENPGSLNVYIYHPDQRDVYGDHFYPTGRVVPFDTTPGDFGPDFVSRPEIVPELGRWYCYEIMVKANTPGERDGRIALWLDGSLIADFMNIRLRETTDLEVDRVGLDLHIGSNTLGVAKKWYDNLVVATAYIGPMFSGSSDTTAPRPPDNLQVR